MTGDVLDFPQPRAEGCPFAPPPKVLELNAARQLSRVRIWDGSVGQQLARMELQIVLPTLLRRIPTMRLAARLEELPFKHDALAYGLYELPVTW